MHSLPAVEKQPPPAAFDKSFERNTNNNTNYNQNDEDNKLMREQLQSLMNRGFDIFGEEESSQDQDSQR